MFIIDEIDLVLVLVIPSSPLPGQSSESESSDVEEAGDKAQHKQVSVGYCSTRGVGCYVHIMRRVVAKGDVHAVFISLHPVVHK